MCVNCGDYRADDIVNFTNYLSELLDLSDCGFGETLDRTDSIFYFSGRSGCLPG
jgi:hypothetical protein